jgi:hypothetical protein
MNLIAPTSPFPPIHFFMQCLENESFTIEQYDHYQKGGYRNRFMIVAANGVQRITIPLKKGKNVQQTIREVEISYEEDWNRQAWQTIVSAYGRAPYFEHYADHIQPFFTKKYDLLWDWNNDILKKIIQLLKIDLKYSFSTDFIKNYDENVLDIRQTMRPNLDLSEVQFKKYAQLFEERHGFISNLSILDLLFCTGPRAKDYLK